MPQSTKLRSSKLSDRPLHTSSLWDHNGVEVLRNHPGDDPESSPHPIPTRTSGERFVVIVASSAHSGVIRGVRCSPAGMAARACCLRPCSPRRPCEPGSRWPPSSQHLPLIYESGTRARSRTPSKSHRAAGARRSLLTWSPGSISLRGSRLEPRASLAGLQHGPTHSDPHRTHQRGAANSMA